MTNIHLESDRLIVRSPYVLKVLERYKNDTQEMENVFELCEEMLIHICKFLDATSRHNKDLQFDQLMQHVINLTKVQELTTKETHCRIHDMTEAIDKNMTALKETIVHDINNSLIEIKSKNDVEYADIRERLDKIPILIKFMIDSCYNEIKSETINSSQDMTRKIIDKIIENYNDYVKHVQVIFSNVSNQISLITTETSSRQTDLRCDISNGFKRVSSEIQDYFERLKDQVKYVQYDLDKIKKEESDDMFLEKIRETVIKNINPVLMDVRCSCTSLHNELIQVSNILNSENLSNGIANQVRDGIHSPLQMTLRILQELKYSVEVSLDELQKHKSQDEALNKIVAAVKDISNTDVEIISERILTRMNEKLHAYDMTMNTVSNTLQQTINSGNEVNISHLKQLITEISTVPKLTKQELLEELEHLIKSTESINKTLNPISFLHVNTKGSATEQIVFDRLSELLQHSDGYDVIKDSGKAQSGDITIRHKNHNPILVEVKCYSKKVPQSEIKKFYRDLESTNRHGLFVSLTSHITGIKHFEVQQLPSSRFAVFLSKNEFDMDNIESAIKLLYKLESLMKNVRGETCEIRFSTEQLCSIQRIMSDQTIKLNEAKHHLKQVSRCLEDICLKQVMNILMQDNS